MDWTWFSIDKFVDTSTGSGALALAVLIFFLAWLTSAVTSRLLRRPLWTVGKLRRKVDQTVVRYIMRLKNLIIFLIAIFIYASLVPSLRALVGTMVAGAGITALVLGFAAKSTLANLISGLSLAIYRPFRIGDMVTIENEYGTVEDITLRHTIVRTWEYKRLIIPNEKIDSMTLTNYSLIDPSMLCIVEVGVSYDTDIDLVRRLLLDEANRCPHRDEKADEPWVRVIAHDNFAIRLRLYVWVPDVNDMWLGRFWLMEHIKKRFDKEGVEIPFPYRTVVFKKDLPPARREEGKPEQSN
jgi:small conductance mechanosensitive channel